MYGVIIGLDIEGYSKTSRSDELGKNRNELDKTIKNALIHFKDFNNIETIDSGDGGFLLIETGDYEKVLHCLDGIMQASINTKGIRFRAIAHIGKYNRSKKLFSSKDVPDEVGYFGDGINIAARNLDAKCLKELLKLNTNSNFVYAITYKFFENIYDESFFDEGEYSKFSFQVKNYHNLIYLSTKGLEHIPKEEQIIQSTDLKIAKGFKNFLISCDFIHERNDKTVSDLNTFYIYPELRKEKPELTRKRDFSSKDLINSIIKIPKNIAIAGDNQSGKTSLCKKIICNLLEVNDFAPIYLQFGPHEKGLIKNKIDKAFSRIYNLKKDACFDNRIKYLIFDDFHLLDNQEQVKYIDYVLKEKNAFTIIIVDSLFNGSIEKQKLKNYFESYTLIEFGHLLRSELIAKWIDFNYLENENYCTQDELFEYVDSTFIKGIIPFTPFYILTVLSARSGFVPINGELTSKGHCYQALIYISLKRMNIPENYIGAFLNLFSNIAYYFYSNGINSFAEEELETFFNNYSNDYNVSFEFEYLVAKTKESTVFYKNSINQYTFFASYFFHYFVAKFLADNLSENFVIKKIEDLYNNLHNEDNAYIGIFIIHHTKDIKILDEVLLNTMVLYDSYPEISLTKDEMTHIDDYSNSLDVQIIEKYDKSQANREEFYRIVDEGRDHPLSDSDEIDKELLDIKKAIRTLEVIGQILKNHSGELKKPRLIECFSSALNAYRRICRRFISEFKEYEKDFADFVVDRIIQMDDNSFTREKIIDFSHRLFISFNLLTVYATIKRCANALGTSDMLPIIKQVSEDMNNPISYCVYIQCVMWYKKSLPIEDAKRKYKDFPKSVQHVIQRLIKEFTDFHHIDYKEKQKIASTFNMQLKT